MSKCPIFLIGEAKCGTSTMHNYISQHPQIHKQPRCKDCSFFIRKETKTKKTFYDYIKYNSKKQLHPYDCSANYFRTYGALETIYSIFPYAKIIVMLRDPIDRIYSNYWMNVKQKVPSVIKYGSFEGAIEKGYLNSLTTKYSDNLNHLFSIFPKDQVHVIKCEDFFKNEISIVKKLFQFLGLKYNNIQKQNPVIPFANSLNPYKQYKTVIEHYPKINPKTREKLKEYFREEVKDVEKILGRKMYSH